MTARPTLTLLALLGLFARCSINGARAHGEQCLMARECAAALDCLPARDGTNRCLPAREGGGVPASDAREHVDADDTDARDATRDASGDARADASTGD